MSQRQISANVAFVQFLKKASFEPRSIAMDHVVRLVDRVIRTRESGGSSLRGSRGVWGSADTPMVGQMNVLMHLSLFFLRSLSIYP